MSVTLPLSTFKDNEIARLIKDLTVSENKDVTGISPVTRSIKCYDIYKDSGVDYIRLPYYYACRKLNIPHNPKYRSYSQTKFCLIPSFTLRAEQDEVVKESLFLYNNTGACVFNVYCSFGKTYLGCYISYLMNYNFNIVTMIVYPRKALLESWLGTFTSNTNAVVHVVKKNSPIPANVNIILCSDGRLDLIEDNVKNLIGHIVLDEAHMFCTQLKCDVLLKYKPNFFTSLTATYERKDGLHRMLDLFNGPNKIVRRSTKAFDVIKLETSFKVLNPEYNKSNNSIMYARYIEELDNNQERNDMILNIIKQNRNRKILVLVYRIEQGINLFNMIKNSNINVSRFLSTDIEYEDADVVVGTVSKIGTGFDEVHVAKNWNKKRLDLLILTSSNTDVEQQLGRVFRSDNPIVIDIVDDFKNVKAHWNQRRKLYTELQGNIVVTKDYNDIPYIISKL